MTVTTVRSRKKPWSELEPQTGVVPAHWIRDLLTSNQMFAFVLLPELQRAIVPTDAGGRLEEAPERLSPFWRVLDAAYDEFRGRGRNTPETLIAQLDHNGKLSGQLTRAGTRRTLVLYPKSGDIMRGARSQTGSFVVDDTLYYFNAASAGEAGYLTALLNAPCLSRAFRESRTSGRDFHQHPWRTIPIPPLRHRRRGASRAGALVQSRRKVRQHLALAANRPSWSGRRIEPDSLAAGRTGHLRRHRPSRGNSPPGACESGMMVYETCPTAKVAYP